MFDARILTFIVYLIVMLAIGCIFFLKNRDVKDYVLGGRSLHPFMSALSAQASDMSGWLLMGLPGLAYLFLATEKGNSFTYQGLYEALWTAIGLLVGTYLNWLLIAKRLRTFTQVADDSLTVSDYFENRFEDQSHFLRIFSAVIIVVFFIIYTSAQFVAGAKLFETILGWNYTSSMLLGAVVIIAYTFLGGFLAVCWTDTIQGILMFFAILLVPFLAFSQVGGTAGLTERLAALANGAIPQFQFLSGSSITLILSSLVWGLGYFGMPHIIVRFMGIRSAREVKYARRIAMVWVIIGLLGAVVIGVVGTAYAQTALTSSEAEKIFIDLIVGIITNPVLQGILLVAILAAIMSTASSQLLVAASAFSEDICGYLFVNLSTKKKLWIMRITVLLIAAISLYFAKDANSSVFRLVQYAWGGLGAAFGPLIILSLYWKQTTRNGAIAGMITGFLVVLLWKQFLSFTGIYELLPAFALSFIAILVVSKLGSQPSKRILERFDASVTMAKEAK
jgi:sodium/proline symporter